MCMQCMYMHILHQVTYFCIPSSHFFLKVTFLGLWAGLWQGTEEFWAKDTGRGGGLCF